MLQVAQKCGYYPAVAVSSHTRQRRSLPWTYCTFITPRLHIVADTHYVL